MKILCISKDSQLKVDMETKLSHSKEVMCMDDYNNETDNNIIFDILLIDYKLDNFSDIMKTIKISKPLLPKIVILNDNNDVSIVDCINSGAYSIVSNPININDLEFIIIMALNQSRRVDKICLDNNIYYDLYRERFYNKSEAISFTKFEFQVLKLLLDNSTKIISYDEIKEKVWKEKKMSIFTMRNVINKIRNKTYYDIIQNNSSSGYQIDKLR